MKRRMVLGLVAGVGALLVGVSALAFGGPGRHAIMKRVVAAALDRANATAGQRAAIHASRDRVFAAIEAHAGDRRGRLEEVLALFEADRLEAAQVEAVRQKMEDRHRQVGDAIAQALTEVHDVLTPEQRGAVTAYVRDRHRAHRH
jgi:protein CpxP